MQAWPGKVTLLGMLKNSHNCSEQRGSEREWPLRQTSLPGDDDVAHSTRRRKLTCKSFNAVNEPARARPYYSFTAAPTCLQPATSRAVYMVLFNPALPAIRQCTRHPPTCMSVERAQHSRIQTKRSEKTSGCPAASRFVVAPWRVAGQHHAVVNLQCYITPLPARRVTASRRTYVQ